MINTKVLIFVSSFTVGVLSQVAFAKELVKDKRTPSSRIQKQEARKTPSWKVSPNKQDQTACMKGFVKCRDHKRKYHSN
jgi:hypothetical protein